MNRKAREVRKDKNLGVLTALVRGASVAILAVSNK
jgi:hypothetical protein